MRPLLWLLAGPNGSGKSTFAQSKVFEALANTPEDAPLFRLNPDERARRLRPQFPFLSEQEVALRAAQESDAELDFCIEERRSVLVETVLASSKLRSRVERAHKRDMEFRMTFVVLRHPDLNVARVSDRVRLGGHGVEEARIRDRWVRSLENLIWFGARADVLSIWDNTRPASHGRPELVLATTPQGRFINDVAAVYADRDTHPALRDALNKLAELP